MVLAVLLWDDYTMLKPVSKRHLLKYKWYASSRDRPFWGELDAMNGVIGNVSQADTDQGIRMRK
jgi:hypothetical protein